MEKTFYKNYLSMLQLASNKKIMLKDSTFFSDKKNSCVDISNNNKIKTLFELYQFIYNREEINKTIYAPWFFLDSDGCIGGNIWAPLNPDEYPFYKGCVFLINLIIVSKEHLTLDNLCHIFLDSITQYSLNNSNIVGLLITINKLDNYKFEFCILLCSTVEYKDSSLRTKIFDDLADKVETYKSCPSVHSWSMEIISVRLLNELLYKFMFHNPCMFNSNSLILSILTTNEEQLNLEGYSSVRYAFSSNWVGGLLDLLVTMYYSETGCNPLSLWENKKFYLIFDSIYTFRDFEE